MTSLFSSCTDKNERSPCWNPKVWVLFGSKVDVNVSPMVKLNSRLALENSVPDVAKTSLVVWSWAPAEKQDPKTNMSSSSSPFMALVLVFQI